MTKGATRTIILVACLWMFCSQAHTAGYAILIGVEEYRRDFPPLPGIGKDIIKMKEVCDIWNIPKENRTVLDGDQATYANVMNAFRQMKNRLTADDWLVFYFSGHGAYVKDLSGDEADGQDEVLVLVDSFRNGKTPQNVLQDDQIGRTLAGLPTRNILVLLDSCYSGTSAKGLRIQDEDFVSKSLFLGAGPLDSYVGKGHQSEDNFISLAACGDNEETYSSVKGSLFTRGLHQAVKIAKNKKVRMTFAVLVDKIAVFIREMANPKQRHTPELDGDKKRSDETATPQPFEGTTRPIPYNATRTHLMPLWSDKTHYRVGDKILLELDLPFEGYLNLIAIDATKEISLLYPNQYHTNNYHQKGLTNLHPADFLLRVHPPGGNTLVLAVLYKDAVNLFRDESEAEAIFEKLAERNDSDLIDLQGNDRIAVNSVLILVR